MLDMSMTTCATGISDAHQLLPTRGVRWNWVLASSSVNTQNWYIHRARISRRSHYSVFGAEAQWSGQNEWSVISIQLDAQVRLSEPVSLALYQSSLSYTTEENLAFHHQWGMSLRWNQDGWKALLLWNEALTKNGVGSWNFNQMSLTSEVFYQYPVYWSTGLRLEATPSSGIRLGLVGESRGEHWIGRAGVFTDGTVLLIANYRRNGFQYSMGFTLGWEKPAQPLLAFGNHVED